MSEPQKVRILLVEDHPVVRLGLKTVIGAQDDMEVVGEAETAVKARHLAKSLTPDLMILALRLEGEFRGIEVCREAKNLEAAPAVLIYTSYNSEEDASSCFLSGADSYVYKGEDSARLLESIRETHAGKRVWLLGIEAKEETTKLQETIDNSSLTPREKEVLGFMLQRFTNSQIARELSVELPTVKTHVGSVLRKLGLTSRQDLF